MKRLVDRLLNLQGEESYDLKLLRQQLKETEQGIITASTKEHLSNLEEHKRQLDQQIMKEQIQNPVLSREQIAFFLDQYKHTDITDEAQ